MTYKMMICIVIVILFMITGCSNIQSDRGLEYIHNNPLLDDQDKAFAIRIYDSVASGNAAEYFQEKLEEKTEGDTDFDFSEIYIYKKWGLGNRTEFAEHEKLYLLVAYDGVSLWKEYKNFNMADISSDDRQFLKEFHSEHGKGPIDLRGESFTAEDDEYGLIYIAKLLSGSHKLDDRLILVFKGLAEALSAIGSH